MNPAPVLSEKIKRIITCTGAAILIVSVTLYLALPVAALFLRTTPDLFFSTLSTPEVMSALFLSLATSVVSLGIVILVGGNNSCHDLGVIEKGFREKRTK